MEFIDAFLLASSLAYFWATLLPDSVTGRSRVSEIIGFTIAGSAILLNTFYFNNSLAWILIGALYVLASLLSYLVYIQWGFFWMAEGSEAAQMCMWAWDMAIAVCCFIKVTF